MYNILNYGAVADGVTVNSQAIQTAIDDCHAHGGGRVLIPAGTFKTGTIWLKSNVELHLEMGASLLGSENIFDYNADDAYPENYGWAPEEWAAKHLIIAHEVDNVAITGLGTINGNASAYYTGELAEGGPYWWRQGLDIIRDKVNFRPGQMFCFIQSTNIHLENVTLKDAPTWTCFFHGSSFITVKGVKVFNPATAPNTDGFDIDSCKYVTVSDCHIDTGDDAIAIRCAEQRLTSQQHCEYITVTNCVFAVSACAFRIGVGIGEINHVRISNIAVYRGEYLINFHTSYLGHGCAKIRDVNFSNISATDVDYCFHVYSANGAWVKDVTVENVRAETCAISDFQCDGDGEMDNFTLRNVELKLFDRYPAPMTERQKRDRGAHALRIHGGTNFRLENVKVKGSLCECEETVSISGCDNLFQRDCNF